MREGRASVMVSRDRWTLCQHQEAGLPRVEEEGGRHGVHTVLPSLLLTMVCTGWWELPAPYN